MSTCIKVTAEAQNVRIAKRILESISRRGVSPRLLLRWMSCSGSAATGDISADGMRILAEKTLIAKDWSKSFIS
jgi:hypothetical protein